MMRVIDTKWAAVDTRGVIDVVPNAGESIAQLYGAMAWHNSRVDRWKKSITRQQTRHFAAQRAGTGDPDIH